MEQVAIVTDSSREGKPVIEDLMKQLQSSCKDCTPKQKETLDRFGVHLKEKWLEFSNPGVTPPKNRTI